MRLTLLNKTIQGKHSKGIFLCVCGKRKELNLDNVRANKTKSCGCLRRETMQKIGRARKIHGKTGTVELAAFIQAKSRCTDRHRKDWINYGGRGIRFLYKSFNEFLADVGSKVDSNLSLDRINNDGNYEPGNCRWATAREQRRNQRV